MTIIGERATSSRERSIPLKNIMRTLSLLVVVAILPLSLGCPNTTKGAKKDAEEMREKAADAMKDAKKAADKAVEATKDAAQEAAEAVAEGAEAVQKKAEKTAESLDKEKQADRP